MVKKRDGTELAQLAEDLLGALRKAANVDSEDPRALITSLKAFPLLEMASPGLTAKFVEAAASTATGPLAAVSPSLAALSVASPPAASLAERFPDLGLVAVLSPEAAEIASQSPELRAIAGESPAHAILAAKAVRSSHE
jgi:hypothetical protein